MAQKVCLLSPDEKFSIPLMKLGRHHKNKGDIIGCDNPDVVYVSSILEKSKDAVNKIVSNIKPNTDIYIGGTTWAKPNAFKEYPHLEKYYLDKLPRDIDTKKPYVYSTKEQRHTKPELSDKFNKKELKEYQKKNDESDIKLSQRIQKEDYHCFGFTTRGCDKNHGYCIVPIIEGRYKKEKPLAEFCVREDVIDDLNQHIDFLNDIKTQCNSLYNSCVIEKNKTHCKGYDFLECGDNDSIINSYKNLIESLNKREFPIRARVLDNNFLGNTKSEDWFFENTEFALKNNIFIDADALDKDYLTDKKMERLSELKRSKLMTMLRFAYDNPTEHEKKQVKRVMDLSKKHNVDLRHVQFYIFIHEDNIDNAIERAQYVVENGGVPYITHPESRIAKLFTAYVNGRRIRKEDRNDIRKGFIEYAKSISPEKAHSTPIDITVLMKKYGVLSINELSKIVK